MYKSLMLLSLDQVHHHVVPCSRGRFLCGDLKSALSSPATSFEGTSFSLWLVSTHGFIFERSHGRARNYANVRP